MDWALFDEALQRGRSKSESPRRYRDGYNDELWPWKEISSYPGEKRNIGKFYKYFWEIHI